MMFIVDSPFII